uniref:Uncharacterized protein n=1 Tax=Rhizophagus irregularis (strain DAOM 181602 / DAOM 197198 / MUCL 43194) TaxID=747089 RepID=U9T217_RHIID
MKISLSSGWTSEFHVITFAPTFGIILFILNRQMLEIDKLIAIRFPSFISGEHDEANATRKLRAL